MSPLMHIQRFLCTPLTAMWWTDEPNKMLNILPDLIKFNKTLITKNSNYDKLIFCENTLNLLSFRLLILSNSIMGKMVSVPVIRSILKYPNYSALFMTQISRGLSSYYKMVNWSLSELEKKDKNKITGTCAQWGC